jgi:hypothetical protein
MALKQFLRRASSRDQECLGAWASRSLMPAVTGRPLMCSGPVWKAEREVAANFAGYCPLPLPLPPL